MNTFIDKKYTSERSLFRTDGAEIKRCSFDVGESALKEAKNLEISNCDFIGKYPIWYCRNVSIYDSRCEVTARAGAWYTDNISVKNSAIDAPKNFRRCNGVTMDNVTFTDTDETLWWCKDVKLKDVKATGDYFGMNCTDVEIDGLELTGNYTFDGVKNITVRNSRIFSRDVFWNAENVTVYDSLISGAYLGWNSKNLTFINCTIESNQGLCFIKELVMRNCKADETDLAFEYSECDVELNSGIKSIINPGSGIIKVNSIGELIREKDNETEIVCDDIHSEYNKPEWLREEK